MKVSKMFRSVAITVIALTTLSFGANAQEKGDMAAGVNLVLGTGSSLTNFGLGAKFQYNVMTPLRLQAEFDYYLKKDYITMWDLSAYGHWLFRIGDRMNVYPLAGFGILNSGVSYPTGYFGNVGVSDSEFAFAVGGGIDFKLTDKLIGNVELKYKFADYWDRLIASVGVSYLF